MVRSVIDEIEVDPLLKLCEVERRLRDSSELKKVPTRATLIKYCKTGKLEHKLFGGQFFVYESSLKEFIRQVQPRKLAA